MLIVCTLGAYAIVGLLLLVPFQRWALPVLDESSHGASRGFRVVISPGLVALWPVILRKWIAAHRGIDPHGSPDGPISSRGIRRMQSLLMKLVAIAIPLLVTAAVLARPASAPAIDPAELRHVQNASAD